MMLDTKLGDLGETLKRPGLLGIALIINFALSPLIMIGLSHAFKLTASLSLVVALFLYATIPYFFIFDDLAYLFNDYLQNSSVL